VLQDGIFVELLNRKKHLRGSLSLHSWW